jgi:hypothetical protein
MIHRSVSSGSTTPGMYQTDVRRGCRGTGVTYRCVFDRRVTVLTLLSKIVMPELRHGCEILPPKIQSVEYTCLENSENYVV